MHKERNLAWVWVSAAFNPFLTLIPFGRRLRNGHCACALAFTGIQIRGPIFDQSLTAVEVRVVCQLFRTLGNTLIVLVETTALIGSLASAIHYPIGTTVMAFLTRTI